jgi:hypothetical protein
MAHAPKKHKRKVSRHKRERTAVRQPNVASVDELHRQYLPAEAEKRSLERMSSEQIGEEFAKQSLARVRATLAS